MRFIHEALTRRFRKPLRNQSAAHNGLGAGKKVIRLLNGNFGDLTLAAMQNTVFKGVHAVAKLSHFGIMRHNNHGHAAGMAELGHEVVGVDIDPGKIAKLAEALKS